MNALKVFVTIYLLAGVIYVLYITRKRPISIWSIPINILGGPITALGIIFKYYFRSKKISGETKYKDILKGKKAVFFDLDGTIWDSAAIWIKALTKVASDNGHPGIDITSVFTAGSSVSDIWKSAISYNNVKFDKKSVKELTLETEQQVVEIIKQMETVNFIEGFENFSVFLKEDLKLKLALVTNTGKRVVDALEEKTNFTYIFDTIITGNDVSRKKPAPEIFLKAARKLKIRPSEALVFEDSPTGSEAAASAGMEQIIIWRSNAIEQDYKGSIYGFFPDFEEMEDFITTPARERFIKDIEMLHARNRGETIPEKNLPEESFNPQK